MSKSYRGNFFEDFRLGQVIHHATPRTLTQGDAALYIALTGARHILHCAAPVAVSAGYRDQTIDDLLAFHVAFGKTVPDISLNAVANLGYADVRFLAPVYAGDTLQTTTEVIGLKQNSNGKSGVVYVRSTATNQRQEPVLTWVRWVMVHKADPSAVVVEEYVPKLPSVVPVAQLSVPPMLNVAEFDTRLTGSPYRWEDYAIGERIDHGAGMTVDESDHTLATKLYQNTAKVHFDALAMQATPMGRRLMYGGHVISVCRALAYNGLENVLTIAAINGGSHANPTFAGDTLYAYSQVLEKWALPDRQDIGAVRLRLVGMKNLNSTEIADPHIVVEGKRKYHPNVVLDLDYTVLMPRHA